MKKKNIDLGFGYFKDLGLYEHYITGDGNRKIEKEDLIRFSTRLVAGVSGNHQRI